MPKEKKPSYSSQNRRRCCDKRQTGKKIIEILYGEGDDE